MGRYREVKPVSFSVSDVVRVFLDTLNGKRVGGDGIGARLK